MKIASWMEGSPFHQKKSKKQHRQLVEWTEQSVGVYVLDVWDTLAEVVIYSDAMTILALCCTSRKMCAVLSDNSLWDDLLLRDFHLRAGSGGKTAYCNAWTKKARPLLEYIQVLKHFSSLHRLFAYESSTINMSALAALEKDPAFTFIVRRVKERRNYALQMVPVFNHAKGVAVALVIALLLPRYRFLRPELWVYPTMSISLVPHVAMPVVVCTGVGVYRAATATKTRTSSSFYYFETSIACHMSVVHAVTSALLISIWGYVSGPILFSCTEPAVTFFHEWAMWLICDALVYVFPYVVIASTGAIAVFQWRNKYLRKVTRLRMYGFFEGILKFGLVTLVMWNFQWVTTVILWLFSMSLYPVVAWLAFSFCFVAQSRHLDASGLYPITVLCAAHFWGWVAIAVINFTFRAPFWMCGFGDVPLDLIFASHSMSLFQNRQRHLGKFFGHCVMNMSGAVCFHRYGFFTALLQRALCHLATMAPQAIGSRRVGLWNRTMVCFWGGITVCWGFSHFW